MGALCPAGLLARSIKADLDVTASQELGEDALPTHWQIGEFDLMVNAQSVRGEYDREQDHRASGRGWVPVPGARPHALAPPVAASVGASAGASKRSAASTPALAQAVEVVDEVLDRARAKAIVPIRAQTVSPRTRKPLESRYL